MSNTDDRPEFSRYSVGDCEMLDRPNGTWLRRIDVIEILNWIVDHDEGEIMLERVRCIKGLIA